jgi:hypothetical protein
VETSKDKFDGFVGKKVMSWDEPNVREPNCYKNNQINFFPVGTSVFIQHASMGRQSLTFQVRS